MIRKSHHHHKPAAHSDHPYADRLHWLQRSYRHVNLWSHHLFGFAIRLIFAAYLLFCILCLVLRYLLLPNIDHYKADIEQRLGAALGRQVSIQRISSSWEGLRPELELRQFAIRDQQGQVALVLPDVHLTVSWLAALTGQLRFYSLEIDHPELELKRGTDGRISVAGWWIDPNQPGDARGMNWMLTQRQISIKNGLVRWNDALRGAPELTLSNVNFIMQNQWQHHKLSLTATPPAQLAGTLDIRANFSHPAFSDNISDYRQWQGQLYGDLPGTDLAAWKSYIDYPFQIDQGQGSVRAWLSFDRMKLEDLTADLKLANVRAQLRQDLQQLDLLSVSGRISAQEINPASGLLNLSGKKTDSTAYGHQISLTNFSFESVSGLRLPATTLTEKFIPANGKAPEQLQLTAKFLDLNVLANLIEHFPMPAEYVALLKRFEPAGQLSDVAINLSGRYPQIDHYQVKANFTNLAIHAQSARTAQKDAPAWPAIPGFSNLSGALDCTDERGTVRIGSVNLALQLGDFFVEPDMHFDRVDMQANWQFRNNRQLQVNLEQLDLAEQEMQAHFSGTHQVNLTDRRGGGPGTLDLTGTVSRFDLNRLRNYLPMGMQPDLHNWLVSGIVGGQVEDVSVRIKGNLDEFPFIKKGLLDQNMFFVSGRIVDGKINYLPGVFAKDGTSPVWPELSRIQGKIVFDRESMVIDADSAETAGVPVAGVKAKIPDLTSHDIQLDIDGNANGPAQDMLRYLEKSPVLEWIGNFTSETRSSGALKLRLKLSLPLMHIDDAKVTGSVALNSNDIALIRDLPLLSQVSGRIDFNERGLSLNNLRAGFLGGSVAVVGGTQKDGVIRIRAEGQMSADGLRKTYPQAALKRLLARIDGNAQYAAIIQVRNRRTELWVDSSLQGMTLALPVPLNKSPGDILPVHFELTSLGGNGGVERDDVKLNLGHTLNGRYILQKNAEDAPRHLVSGGLGVNVPAPMPDSGLSAYLELGSLNVDELQALLPEKANQSEAARKNEPAGAEIDLGQYLEPDEIAARATELVVKGKKLDQVVFGASRNGEVWQANIDSRQITGYLTWSNADHGLGMATARLSSLNIPESSGSDVVDLLQSKNLHDSIPGLDVVADNFELYGKKLGRLELLAKNVSKPNQGEVNIWQIDKLSLVNPDAELTGEGSWVSSDGGAAPKSQTGLKYQLQLNDAGKTLNRLGYANVIAGGKGKLTGEVSWSAAPYALDIPSLSGKIQLDMQSGQFLKAEPGAAKLLSVLNLQALPRRLMLDFRDVFSDGFAFDGITADAVIDKGVLTTDNLKMRGVSATVLLSGSADIRNETQNLRLVVVPDVNAGAASVVYGLAVNPVIGLGTFLAQLFLRQPLMKAFTYEYQINGSWKEPNVVKL